MKLQKLTGFLAVCLIFSLILGHSAHVWAADKQAPDKNSATDRKSADSKDTLLQLISNINQRTYNALLKSQKRTSKNAELNGQLRLAIQLLREYGYTSSSMIWQGDFLLIFKTLTYTQKCSKLDLIKSDNGILDPAMQLNDEAAALKLLSETFSPAEIAAIQYEIMSAKMAVIDTKRKQALDFAGYNTKDVFRLTSKWDD